MKLSLVFRENGQDLQSGKSFEVQMTCMPRLEEHITFDYIEEDSESNELYDLLQSIGAESFLVTGIYHYCGINTIGPVAALIFVEAVRPQTFLKHGYHT